MRAVGIKELKNRLSEYVRLAAGGETILVTDRDRVVAELSAPGEARSPFVTDAVLLDLVRKGLITPPAVVEKGPPPRARKPVMKFRDLMKDLDWSREDR